jgi:sodium/bile acid cotransporter 7
LSIFSEEEEAEEETEEIMASIRENAVSKFLLSLLINQWFLIAIGFSCLLAYFFPNVASPGGYLRAEYTILYGAVALSFLISGMNISKEKFIKHLLNWRLHLLVQGTSFLIAPAVFYAIVEAIVAGDKREAIDPATLAGFILVGCLPTSIASNVVMTRSAGGDEAAALVEVVVANLLGPFITPVWAVTLLPKTPTFSPWRDSNSDLGSMYANVFKQLGLTVLLPFVLGQLLRWTYPAPTIHFFQKLHLAKLGSACILLLIWASFSSCFATNALPSLSTESILLTIFLNIALYCFLTLICFLISRPLYPIPYLLPKIPPTEAIAVCFCGPAKTTALGIPLLYAMWTNMDLFTKAKTSVPVLLFNVEQIFCAHFMVFLFRWWVRNLEGGGGCVGDEDEEVGERGASSSSSNGDTDNIASSGERPVRESDGTALEEK